MRRSVRTWHGEVIECDEPRVELAVCSLNHVHAIHWIKEHFILTNEGIISRNGRLTACPNFDPMVEWDIHIVTDEKYLRGYRYTNFVLIDRDQLEELGKWQFLDAIYHSMYDRKPHCDPVFKNHHLEYTDPDHLREYREKLYWQSTRLAKDYEWLYL